MGRKGNAALIVLLFVAAVGGYYAYEEGLIGDNTIDLACAEAGGDCVDSCSDGETVNAQCPSGETCCIPDDPGRATGPGI